MDTRTTQAGHRADHLDTRSKTIETSTPPQPAGKQIDTYNAVDILRQAIYRIYDQDDPRLTIHMMDGRAARVRRAIEQLYAKDRAAVAAAQPARTQPQPARTSTPPTTTATRTTTIVPPRTIQPAQGHHHNGRPTAIDYRAAAALDFYAGEMD